jgi:outer membrane protein OmpA-like peptidoglycan-associated protein
MVIQAEPSTAQNASTGESYSPSIIINTEVLDSLTPQGPVVGLPFRPGYPGSNVVMGTSSYRRSGALLFPPTSAPQSRLVSGAGASTTAVITSAAAGATQAQETSRILTPSHSGTAAAVAPSVPAAQAPTVAVKLPEQSGDPAAPAVQTPTVAVSVPKTNEEPAMPAAPDSDASEPAPQSSETSAVVVATPNVPSTETAQTTSKSTVDPSQSGNQTLAQTTTTTEPAAEAPQPQAPEPSESLAKESSSDDEPTQSLSEQVLATVTFDPGSSDLNDEGRAQLERVATAMKSNTSMRVQLQAFAGEDDDSPNASRRLSLSRALVVRSFLIERDIVSTRMQVRALGDKFGDGPADRVDIRPQGG